MDYRGYLIKINGAEFPKGLIAGYSSIPDRQQDKNSYSDNDGLTHRKILPHTKTTIKITTGIMSLAEKAKLKELFPAREFVEIEYWNDDTDSYTEGRFYAPDIEYEVMDYDSKTVFYRPVTIEFIEY